MKLRNGNNRKIENTFQLGLLGIDFASEGPLTRRHNSSYIFNYRYSTTGLLGELGMMDIDGTLDYQVYYAYTQGGCVLGLGNGLG